MLGRLKATSARLGFRLLDITTRSWPGFWATTLLCTLYISYNSTSRDAWDQYPFTGLMCLLTVFSYMQNIIIMTAQRENDALQAESAKIHAAHEANYREMIREVHEMTSALHAMMEVQIIQTEQAEQLLAKIQTDVQHIEEEIKESNDSQ